MYLTWLDSNSWLIELADKRILLDPWLVGELTFGNIGWLFKGKRSSDRPIPENIDLILLSQGIEDHAHPETLKRLDRSIPVVASPSAAKVAQSIGFSSVTALKHGESFTIDQFVQIQATPGSQLGPGTQENGYLLTELPTGVTLYYEPHGNHPSPLPNPIDVVITPLIDLALPLVGSIIKGTESALDLTKQAQPQIILPTAAGGEIEFEGILISVLKAIGTTDDFRSKLAQANLTTQVIEPKPGERFEISLQASAIANSL
ncbi:MBL fold metallo-hydrolase [Leptolyngbya sp. NIES-2104]|uniref:MBL fold metallo-hydrolase n=1 Tax=Leptolyngbya sp. NIES-2104 TaxID=1552121 RepID=UPI0006EC966B|nr:MBL fold metallo-hydrolase [Leptolyngbya sp. NIES-2104]GAP94013.1 inactivated Zn-dependent hydrolase of the beta-lactamase fold [Leptolyngbya sp. NIES-2104]